MNEESKDLTTVETPDTLTQFMKNGFDSAFDKKEPVIRLTVSYLEMKQKEKKSFVVVNKTKIEMTDEKTGEIKLNNAVILMAEDKQTYLAMQTKIVNACGLCELYSTVSIERVADVPLGGGKTMHNFNVELLN